MPQNSQTGHFTQIVWADTRSADSFDFVESSSEPLVDEVIEPMPEQPSAYPEVEIHFCSTIRAVEEAEAAMKGVSWFGFETDC